MKGEREEGERGEERRRRERREERGEGGDGRTNNKKGGKSVVHYHKNNFVKALLSLYPEIDLRESKFSSPLGSPHPPSLSLSPLSPSLFYIFTQKLHKIY
jgi:hypothetical protein